MCLTERREAWPLLTFDDGKHVEHSVEHLALNQVQSVIRPQLFANEPFVGLPQDILEGKHCADEREHAAPRRQPR